MKFSDMFLERVKKQTTRPKIAIAISRPIPETVESLKKASEFVDLVVVGAKVDGLENIVEEDQEKASNILIGLLKDEKVDGIVRGQVKDSYTLDEFHRQFEREPFPSNRKVVPVILEKDEYSVVIPTASIYQGMTLEDKKYEIDRVIRYMKEDLGTEPNIAVMSTLRPTSKVGKYPMLDDMAAINKQLAEYLREEGYQVNEYYFEYETAIWSKANLIIPSMGLVGNTFFKALLYLGGWSMIACPYLDFGVVYENGTRNEKDFFWHIIHCASMISQKK